MKIAMELYPDKHLEAIVTGCRKRDMNCQRKLFERYYKRMLTVCYRYCPDRDEAEDIAQEGFIKLFEKIDNYDARGTFEGWVRRLFVNHCLDYIQKKKHYNVSYDAIY
ncbi:MAG: sigma-70 family RNA polymerase sigma factor, partial [Flavobacteriales bacterium]|nr:sigma-70 family RNA polymerase sigma factor [Flavobacteriales bacterium]